MSKYSVKRPFTVLVGVILVLVLGFVSLTGMPTDLLPTISLPYLIVVTTYPGASPEQVESELTEPLESALGTVNGVENVTSTSSENYSMVMLEFAEDTDMDSAMVKASTALNQLADTLPDMAGTPSLIEMSPDMMATQYIAVDCEGMDIYELSEYTDNTVVPALERVTGVASVSATGLVEKTVQVTLNQAKIDNVNDKLLVKVSNRLAEAKEKLEENEGKIQDGLDGITTAQNELNNGKQQLESQKTSLTQQLKDAITQIDEQIPVLEEKVGSLEQQIFDVQSKIDGAKANPSDVPAVDIPEITFAIDDAVLAQTRTALAATLGAAYNDAAMPANLEDAKANPQKMVDMLAAINAAKPIIRQQQSGLIGADIGTDDTTADAAVAAKLTELANGIATQVATIAGLDAQIAQLELQQQTAATDADKAVIEAQLAPLRTARAEADAARAALQQQSDALTALQGEITLFSTTSAALLNAQQLIQARKLAEATANNAAAQLENNANTTLNALRSQLTDLNNQLDRVKFALGSLNDQRARLQSSLQSVEANPLDTGVADVATQVLFSGMEAQLSLGQYQIDSGKTQLEAGKTQIESAWEEYNNARDEALKSANLNQLLTMKTLAQMISAQNFSMPAGYIQDGDEKYLLKVGDKFETVDDLTGALLCHVDGIGDVRLDDVADITITDNAGESYAKVGENQAILLAVYKGSTASTSDVSDACNAEVATLMSDKDGLRLTALMDQGDYIRLIINSVMSNLIWGAVLAIIVLALFLKDIRPTLVVAISIPLSVLFAVVLMYFTGVTLNMISLSGLALGIGMLVDNSIVVIENIYRLRARGVPAAQAAVQGARQVAGAIASSTLTTICVFLPLVFAEGLTRELLSDMALTIGYSLGASLFVALTVVPCAGSTLLKKAANQKHSLFDKLTSLYGKLLGFCLRVKIVPLGLSIFLLAFSVWRVAGMGLVLIPEMSSNELSVTVQMPENEPDEKYFATADAVMEQLLTVNGIETAGAMTTSATTSAFMGAAGSGDVDNSNISYYIILNKEGGRDQAAVKKEIEEKTAGFDCEIEVGSGSSMDMSALTGSGVEVDIYGSDLDMLLELSKQVEGIMAEVPGITEISNGQEKGDDEVRVVVDKDKAMRLGLTVARVYAEIAAALTTDTTSTTLTAQDGTYTVEIIDTTKTPELSDIFDHEFTTTTTDEDGKQVSETHKLGEFASRRNAEGVASIGRENQSRMMSVTSSTADGYNTARLAAAVQQKLDEMDLPAGYTVAIGGETTQVNDMVIQMAKMLALALVLIYLIMVAQFQSLLSPFIVLFTIPLAFTGGALALLAAGEGLSLMSLMGFLVLMGVVVNNGIVFVDYTNQLRIGGLKRRDALIATGKTRMRPIFMTAMTTILAMVTMLFSADPGSEMGRGMAIVIIGGLMYATLMTLFIVPVIYDILYKKNPTDIDVGEDGLDDLPDDAAEFAAELEAEQKQSAGHASATDETPKTPAGGEANA